MAGMNYQMPARVREMLERMTKQDRTMKTWLLNKLIEDEYQRRGLPPIPDGDDAPDA